jgi:CubicO group peptidase (beta-lactamase class C family)
MFAKAFKIIAGAIVLGVAVGAGYLVVAPPDLLKVGTNYSAKMICSNVFVAGRDADEVLKVDVQAPGHPLLGYVSTFVDETTQTVEARLLGFLAPAKAQYRAGLGCTSVHQATLSDKTLPTLPQPAAAEWPQGNLVTPSQDPDLLSALSDPQLLGEGYRAVIIVRSGRIIGETFADGFDAETPLLGWSMTKSVTSGLIGTLIQSGTITLSDEAASSFPEWAIDDRQEITVADMLAMTPGLRWNEGYGDVSDVTRMLYLEDDMAGFAQELEAEAPVGTVFNYSSGTSTMLSRIWQDRLDGGGLGYPQQALFAPLGMTSAVMETDANDTFVGSSYMYATARDWARYGQFLLQKGVWNGQQILPEGFTDWMFEPVEASNGTYTKGHLWREAPGDAPPFEDGVWLRGHDGQAIGIFPSRELVIVRLGLTPSALNYSTVPLTEAIIAAISD